MRGAALIAVRRAVGRVGVTRTTPASPATLLIAAGMLATLLLASSPTGAHLLPSGASSLIGMMASADGMLVARSAAATHERDASLAATPFLAREALAGDTPQEGFVLDQGAPILRYAEAQDAILLVGKETAGTQIRWRSVQPAGAAIVLPKPTVDERTRTVLRALWRVAHPAAGAAPDVPAAAAALIDALSLPEQKLRALAFLDLSTLAEDPAHVGTLAASRLLRYGDQPGDDAQLAPAVRDLGRKLQASGESGASGATGGTPAGEGAKP